MEPTSLHAGDSVSWSRDLPRHPAADGWALAYVFSGPERHEVAAIAGSPYRVELASSETTAWSPGLYAWVALASRGDERVTVAKGVLQVDPNLAQLDSLDARTHAQRMLTLIEAALEKRIPKDQQSYEIDGQRLDRIPIERLNELRLQYRREVMRERNRKWPTGRTVYMVLR